MLGSYPEFSSNSISDFDSDSDSNSSSMFISLVIFVSIHDSVKNYSCHNVTNKINTFDVLTFMQMRTASKITTKFLTC